MNREQIELSTPGEILQEEFLEPLGITPQALAECLYVSPSKIAEIINGKRGITAETSLKLSRFFGTTPEFWMNIQNRYDAEREKKSC